MNNDDILNPVTDSLEACYLITAAFFLMSGSADDQESRDQKIKAISLLGLRRLKQAWSSITGRPVDVQYTTEYDTDEFARIVGVIAEEFREAEDAELIFEQILLNIENADLMKMLVSFAYAIASTDGDISSMENGLVSFMLNTWDLHEMKVSPESGVVKPDDVYEIWLPKLFAEYSFADLNPTSVAAASINRLSGKDVDNSSCFIATATLGENHTALTPLRWYRDDVLLKHTFGQNFVSWYYAKGPAMAKFISEKPVLKWFVRTLFIIPVATAVTLFKNNREEKKSAG